MLSDKFKKHIMKRKYANCVLSIILVASVFLSGCSVKYNKNLSDSDTSFGDSNDANAVESSSTDYLSDGVSLPGDGEIENNNNITAEAAIMVSESSEKILYEKNMYERIYPASVTKILTALIAMEECDLGEDVTFSYDATHFDEVGAMVCGFEEGDSIKLRKLLYCMLIFSGNDTAVAIAEHVSGSVDEFANLMNKRALELGCSDSHFMNPSGLHDDNHYTTAYDMYLIFRECITHKLFRKIVNTDRYVVGYKDADGEKHDMTVTTTNSYVSGSMQPPANVRVLGGKTGTTSDAGYCLSLYSTDSSDNGYISIIFKAGDSYELYSQMNELLAYANEDEEN